MGEYLLLQITDIHLTSEGELFPGVRPRDNLVAGLALVAASGLAPDLTVLTGDLANAGEASCYEDLASIMDQATEALGGRVVYLPGNHDARPAFRRHLLGEEEAASPINRVHWVGGLRVVLLDSVVPGSEFGHLSGETLEFLNDALDTTAPDGTVLALHHPPVPSPVEPMARIMLRHPGRLAEAIDGSDVRLVLCGHNHHVGVGDLASVPVWVAPASAYLMDVLSPDAFRAIPGCSFSRIALSDSGVSVSPIPVPLGPG